MCPKGTLFHAIGLTVRWIGTIAHLLNSSRFSWLPRYLLMWLIIDRTHFGSLCAIRALQGRSVTFAVYFGRVLNDPLLGNNRRIGQQVWRYCRLLLLLGDLLHQLRVLFSIHCTFLQICLQFNQMCSACISIRLYCLNGTASNGRIIALRLFTCSCCLISANSEASIVLLSSSCLSLSHISPSSLSCFSSYSRSISLDLASASLS